MPALCCATEVSQGSWMGSSPRSDLPEDCHGAGKASGSVKSCIDQKVLRTGSAELAGLKGRGRYSGPGRCLPCWMCFGPSGGANFSTRKGTHPWAGRLFAWSHPRERREGPAERVPGGKGSLDTGQMVQHASCPLAVLHQGPPPLISQHTHWAMLALALPRSPSCLGTSPGPLNSSRLPRELAQGKTRPPPLKYMQLPRELLCSTTRLGRTDNNLYLGTRDKEPRS